MLILVAVTVSYSIKSGLLNKAQEAKIGEEKEQEKEELYSAVWTAYNEKNGKIEKDKLLDNLSNGWSVEGEEAPYTCTSPKENKFILGKDGKIENAVKQDSNLHDAYVTTQWDIDFYKLKGDENGIYVQLEGVWYYAPVWSNDERRVVRFGFCLC